MKVFIPSWLARAGALALLAAGLASCGGGGGDGGTAPPATAGVSLFAGALQTAGSRDGVGAAAQFSGPTDVALDAAGNVYVADTVNQAIRKVAADGTVTTFAGAAGQSGSADGAAANARFSTPQGVAVDAGGNVYVSDTGNHTVRKITPAGIVSTLAGVAGQSGNVNGPATTARLNAPQSIAVDGLGNVYVVDQAAIRKVAPDGTVSTFAAKPDTVTSVAADSAGNVYVAAGPAFGGTGLNASGTVRKFGSGGQALPFGTAADGVASEPFPQDIAVDAGGNVYVVSNGFIQPSPSFSTVYRSIDRFTPDGRTVTTLVGTTNDARTVDGAIAAARFIDPRAVAVGPNGRIAVAETSTSAIRLVDTQRGLVTTLAGGMGGGDFDGSALAARFNEPRGLAASADGTLYVADSRNHSVRRIGANGTVSTLARGFRFPQAVAIAPAGGTVYMLDAVVSIAGRFITAIAPNGTTSPGGSLFANSTAALAVDAAGNLYASENGDVVVLAPGGAKRVLASGVQADNLAVDAGGTVYFTSSRRTVGTIDAAGGVAVRAGLADQPGIADGTGEAARFTGPSALAVDNAGNMYVGDGTRIRKVTPDGRVNTIADVAQVQGGQAGLATSLLGNVNGLAWSSGVLYASVLNAIVRVAPVN